TTRGTVTDNVRARGLRDGLYTLLLRVVDHKGHVGEDRQAFILRRDHSLLPGFPVRLRGSVVGGPIVVNLDGDKDNELVVADASGQVHAFRANGTELPGWPVSTPAAAYPTQNGELTYHPGCRGGPSVADIDGNG